MPEQPADTLTEREIAAQAGTDALPIDAGFEVPIAAVEAGTEGAVKKRLGIGAWFAIVWLGILLFLMVFASVLPIDPPRERFSGLAFQKPFCTASDCLSGHPLGGDDIGRDMLSRRRRGLKCPPLARRTGRAPHRRGS